MAKINKNTLKSIVKECLVEILSEGIASQAHTPPPPKNGLGRSRRPIAEAKARRQAADNISLERKITDSVDALTDDPVMGSIFADTAKTTLQEQYAAEGPGNQSGPVPAGDGSAGVELDDIFGEASQNWAALAFTEKKPR
jgi:hypothetical protein